MNFAIASLGECLNLHPKTNTLEKPLLTAAQIPLRFVALQYVTLFCPPIAMPLADLKRS